MPIQTVIYRSLVDFFGALGFCLWRKQKTKERKKPRVKRAATKSEFLHW